MQGEQRILARRYSFFFFICLPLPSLPTQEKEFSTSLSCVKIIMILDPIPQRLLFLVYFFSFSRFIITYFSICIHNKFDLLRQIVDNKKRKGNFLKYLKYQKGNLFCHLYE